MGSKSSYIEILKTTLPTITSTHKENMICWQENCKTCKEIGLWEYIWGVSFTEFVEVWEWKNMIASFVVCGIFIYFLKWWALIPILIIANDMEGGWSTWFLSKEYMQDPEEPKTKCIAGNINCEICDENGNF